MEYVAVGFLVLLLIGAFVAFLVMQATRRSSPATGDTAHDMPGIGTDASPLGDTTQHAGEQEPGGRTVAGNDAGRSGGTGAPTTDLPQRSQDEDPPDGRFKRDPIGGEGEGTPAIESERPRRPGV
jgi:hypothetical protein